jgi:hypothetical protein
MDYEPNDPKTAFVFKGKAPYPRSFLAQLLDQPSNILNTPRGHSLTELHWLRVSPLRDPFIPGRPAHWDDSRIVLAADDVAQPKKADFGVCFGFHMVLLLCCWVFNYNGYV